MTVTHIRIEPYFGDEAGTSSVITRKEAIGLYGKDELGEYIAGYCDFAAFFALDKNGNIVL